MKRYAVLTIKGKEYIKSRKDIIFLGDKNYQTHLDILETLNKGNFLNNLKDGMIYEMMTENEALKLFNTFYVSYKVVYGKYKIKLRGVMA